MSKLSAIYHTRPTGVYCVEAADDIRLCLQALEFLQRRTNDRQVIKMELGLPSLGEERDDDSSVAAASLGTET